MNLRGKWIAFPTPVGMNRTFSAGREKSFRVPHARGDEPTLGLILGSWV